MTKKQLLKKLENIPDSARIIISSDAEGNRYCELDEVSHESGLRFYYKTEDSEFGPIQRELQLVTTDDIDEYFTEKHYKKAKDCVVLYPK
jgi:hypothetical protein